MKKDTTEEIKSYFSGLYDEYGVDEKSLGWTKNKQRIRFEQLIRFIPRKKASLLDLGCGFGDMYDYLEANDEAKGLYEYYGIDLMPEFIRVAQDKHSAIKDHFECADFMKKRIDNAKWDWIVESGIFGHKLFEMDSKMYEYVDEVVKKSLLCSREGISFDFLSDRVDYKASDDCFFANPMKIMEIAYRYSRNIVLNNSIMPFEFCVTICKDDSFLKETTVFNKYYGG